MVQLYENGEDLNGGAVLGLDCRSPATHYHLVCSEVLHRRGQLFFQQHSPVRDRI